MLYRAFISTSSLFSCLLRGVVRYQSNVNEHDPEICSKNMTMWGNLEPCKAPPKFVTFGMNVSRSFFLSSFLSFFLSVFPLLFASLCFLFSFFFFFLFLSLFFCSLVYSFVLAFFLPFFLSFFPLSFPSSE